MDIIKRNFFRILRSGALNEYEALEPMSAFKWNRLFQMVKAQGVNDIAMKGLKNHTFDVQANIPKHMMEELVTNNENTKQTAMPPQLSNKFLNRRLRKIQNNERHQIDASMTTVDILNIIVRNIELILNQGISLKGIAELGSFLRTKGDKVDFVKLENWLSQLHIERMAQLEGSILIEVFGFELDEIPFVKTIEKQAYPLTIRTLNHTEEDTAKQWHFKEGKNGFVKNNSAQLRRNLRRSIRYINFAPVETASNFIHNFAKNLSEIEE